MPMLIDVSIHERPPDPAHAVNYSIHIELPIFQVFLSLYLNYHDNQDTDNISSILNEIYIYLYVYINILLRKSRPAAQSSLLILLIK